MIHPLEGADGKTTYLLTIVDIAQLRRLLGHVHDEREFLSRYGIRSLSKLHEAQPFELGRSPRRPTSRPSRPRRSRAATRTGAGRSGFRLRS